MYSLFINYFHNVGEDEMTNDIPSYKDERVCTMLVVANKNTPEGWLRKVLTKLF